MREKINKPFACTKESAEQMIKDKMGMTFTAEVTESQHPCYMVSKN